MSEITLSTQNLSKFNRRAQKAIKETLGVSVSLSQAQEIMAKIVGTRSYHELQEVIKKSPPPFKAATVVKEMLDFWRSALQGDNTDISLYICNYDNEICFEVVYVKQISNTDTRPEVFCFFDNLLQSSEKELREKISQYFNEIPMPADLVEKVVSFHTKFSPLVPKNKLNTLRGAFFDYMQVNNMLHSDTDAHLLLENGTWLA